MAVVDDYANSVEPPIRAVRCPPGTLSMNKAERGQMCLLVPGATCFFAAEGQLDFRPMPNAEAAEIRAE